MIESLKTRFLFVQTVLSRTSMLCLPTYTNAKGVTLTMSTENQQESHGPTPSETDSANVVRFRAASLSVGPLSDEVTMKCNTCKKPTLHHWGKVEVADMSNQIDPIELMQMSRRLKVCTNCGTLSLTK